MSGKAYTMKEMKAIVDYLTERRAYGEIKGRKMWVNFEKSKLTDRTWQSLKETFLKRILPDIHNPYYQLSLVQITSFRQGYDVEAKLNNKLEVMPMIAGSNTDAEQPAITEQPSSSNIKDGENKSGEEAINPMTVLHHRASAETIVLDTCYETAEDIQRELESPKPSTDVKEKDSDNSPPKTLRDFITYSEPLTPMLQEVIDDFATDEERDPSDDEPQMEIAEDVENDKEPKNLDNETYDETVEISSGPDDVNNTEIAENGKNTQDEKQDANENDEPSQDKNISADNPKTNSAQNIIANDDCENVVESTSGSNIDDINKKNKDLNENPPPEMKTKDCSKTGTENNSKTVNLSNAEKLTFSQNTCMENFSNTTTDTLIPNNQEAISKNSQPTDKFTKKEIPTEHVDKNPIKLSKKRANSQEPTASNQKKPSLSLSSKSISVSDTDASNKRDNKLKIVNNLKEKNLQTSDKGSKTVNPKQNVAELAEIAEVEEVVKENVKEVINERISNQDNLYEPITANDKNIDHQVVVENPCLKSVSLYDEEFTSMKYNVLSDDALKKTRQEKKITVTKDRDLSENEIVLLKSNSEDEEHQAPKKKPTTARNVRSERDQALANVFGFSSGAATSKRKRRISYQNKRSFSQPRRQSYTKASSGSSEWSSESDAEFVSPPRGRKRHARKYLKPKPARILSLEEEGGLFVMYGKKIYPVVKDGKIMKNVTYTPDRDSENEEESFWKLKYIEEKKRTAQLTKLLQQSSNDDHHSIEGGSALIQQKSSPINRKIMKNETEVQEKNTVRELAPKETAEHPKSAPHEVKTLKIKITKLNEEVQLEGHWSQIHPVLDHVVQIFHKETETKPTSEQRNTSTSGMSTPLVPIIDQEAHDKVNKIETEIFKEIEALDKEPVSSTPQSDLEKANELSKKRGRPTKSVSPRKSVSEVPEKKPKKTETEKLLFQDSMEKLSPAKLENSASPETRQSRALKKVLRENTERNEGNVPNTRTKRTKELPPVAPTDDDANIRYKFPSPPPSGKKKSRKSSANRSIKELKTKNRYIKKRSSIISSDYLSINSDIESNQGYQDSDISPTLSLKKKKKYTATYARRKFKNQLKMRRKTFWELEMSDQSSNSCPDSSRNSRSDQKSRSDIYRSESYQLLMPKKKYNFNNLERIDENNFNEPKENRADIFNSNTTNLYFNKQNSSKTGDAIDVDYSSNVSLPPSPVLSIVENLSISNHELHNIGDDINKKDVQGDSNIHSNNSDFKITDLDVTMPLMQPDSDFQSKIQNITEQQFDINNLPTVVTESFINKICTVNIHENPTLSETINQKLRNLLLESAKKAAGNCNVTNKGANDKMEVHSEQTKTDTQVKIKKRCSTPLKRKNTRKKSKQPELAPSVEEEHTESCSHGGRRSCPPLISISNDALNIVESENVTGGTINNKKGRKKKENIIKVKILRPRTRSYSKETNIGNTNQKGESLHGDSGIIDTLSSVLLQGLEESVDLIHNHSETCLQANDCAGDSVQFVENSMNSVISLDTQSDESMEIEEDIRINSNFIQNAQSGLLKNLNHSETFLGNGLGVLRTNNILYNEGTTYHTPLNSLHSTSSILTEDLSDQEVTDRTPRPTKWYSLSEDETNTNFAFPTRNINASYGADLNNIFPITCAIPNLSTITEMSNDKALGARPSRDDSSAQSIFDNNIDSNC